MKVQTHPLTPHVLVIGIFFAAFVIFVSHHAALMDLNGCNCGGSSQGLEQLFGQSRTPAVPQPIQGQSLTANVPTAEDATWKGYISRTQLSMAQLRGEV